MRHLDSQHSLANVSLNIMHSMLNDWHKHPNNADSVRKLNMYALNAKRWWGK